MVRQLKYFLTFSLSNRFFCILAEFASLDRVALKPISKESSGFSNVKPSELLPYLPYLIFLGEIQSALTPLNTKQKKRADLSLTCRMGKDYFSERTCLSDSAVWHIAAFLSFFECSSGRSGIVPTDTVF